MQKIDLYMLKPLKPLKTPLTGLELQTIKDLWIRCRFIEVRLLRPQGVKKPISFKPINREGGLSINPTQRI